MNTLRVAMGSWTILSRGQYCFRKVCGESVSVDDNVCDEWKTELSKTRGDY